MARTMPPSGSLHARLFCAEIGLSESLQLSEDTAVAGLLHFVWLPQAPV